MFDRVPVCGTLLLLYSSNGAAELVCAHFVTSTRRMVHSCWIRELDTVLERNEKKMIVEMAASEREREKEREMEFGRNKVAKICHVCTLRSAPCRSLI